MLEHKHESTGKNKPILQHYSVLSGWVCTVYTVHYTIIQSLIERT